MTEREKELEDYKANFLWGKEGELEQLLYEFVNCKTEEYREEIYKNILTYIDTHYTKKDEVDEIKRELSAIEKLADTYDEFGGVFDPECRLPNLAERLYCIISEILGKEHNCGDECAKKELEIVSLKSALTQAQKKSEVKLDKGKIEAVIVEHCETQGWHTTLNAERDHYFYDLDNGFNLTDLAHALANSKTIVR